MSSIVFARTTRVVLAAASVVVAASLGGCAFSNEGAIDYRKAEPPTDANFSAFYSHVASAPLSSASAAPGSRTTSASASASDAIYVPKILTPLLRKDVSLRDANGQPSEARIVAKDKVSIRLREGFLRDCNEFWRNPLRRLKKNCEIAVLFRAIELGKGQDFNFKPGAERDARLVYFSHDVEAGQFFNFHNMPVYGPLEYKDTPIGLDIFVIEIDAEDKQAYALLKSLAAVGGVPMAPASPVLAVLDGLGKSLLDGGTDDVEFRYSMVLDPASGYKGTLFATAEAGDYVFIRSEARQGSIDWSRLYLDHNTGRVWIDKDGEKVLYRDNTYLTVQVLRNAGSVDVTIAQNTYGDFRDALEKDVTARADKITETMKKAFEPVLLKRVQGKAFHNAQKLLEDIAANCKPSAEATSPIGSQRTYDLHALLKDSVEKFNACGASPKPKPAELDELRKQVDLDGEQIDYLLKKLRTRAKVTDKDSIRSYDNHCDGFASLTFDAFAAKICPAP